MLGLAKECIHDYSTVEAFITIINDDSRKLDDMVSKIEEDCVKKADKLYPDTFRGVDSGIVFNYIIRTILLNSFVYTTENTKSYVPNPVVERIKTIMPILINQNNM
jgi:hypothetical protein